MNLLVNAHQAVDEDGRIELATGCIDDELVFVRIADNGSGIGPDAIDKIWDPFFTTKELAPASAWPCPDLRYRHAPRRRNQGREPVGQRLRFTVLLPRPTR